MEVLVSRQRTTFPAFIKSYHFLLSKDEYEIAIGLKKSPNVHEFVKVEDIFSKPPVDVTKRAQGRTNESIDKDFHVWMQYFDDNHMEFQCSWIAIIHEK